MTVPGALAATLFKAAAAIVYATDIYIGYVTLLINGDSGTISDAVGGNTLSLTGSPAIDATTYKYGTGSMRFNGSTDIVRTGTTSSVTLGTGDFTIEAWIYPLSYGGTLAGATIFGTVNGSRSGYSLQLGESQNRFRVTSNAGGGWADMMVVTTGPALNTWSHVALTRQAINGTQCVFRIYINGTQQATSTQPLSLNFSGTTGVIGCFNDGTLSRYYNGYIDDLRVTKGYARYTTNFTPPTAALPTH
jgi:hypothetical protein